MMGERYGFTPWDIAKMHPQEIRRYLKGAKSREEQKKRNAKRDTNVSRNQRQRESEALEKYS
jgi:hypothetical protein